MAKFSRGAARALALVAVLSLLLAVPVAADNESPSRLDPEGDQSRPDVSELDPEFIENAWFVEFEGEPLARGGSQAQQARERAGLQRAADRAGIDFEERFDFQRLWNGLSVEATAADARTLARLGEVAAIYPVALVDAPEPDEVDPEMSTALTMTGADIAQSELGLTGDGLSVAIIDTGIDYGHPDLGGDGPGTTFPTDRVTQGFDYVGEDYDASDPDNDVPDPDPDPMDHQGHGTHVAGIVGADAADDDGVTGVAPDVTFGAYKVFAQGSSSSDVIVAALEDAHADGMDIVNMSLGAAFTWGDYPTSQASDTLVDDGTVVISSIGNSGREGVFSSGAPGNAAKSIGVASADNLEMDANVFEIEGEEVPWVGIGDAPAPPQEGQSDPIEWIGRGCASLGDELEGDPEGKVALMARGECTFEEKYNVAVDAGATAVVIHNNIPGLFSGGGIVPQDDIWAAGIRLSEGEWLRGLLEESEDDIVIDFSDGETSVINPSAGLLSDFSSYGMTPDLQLTPDVTAPGGLITSTYPLASGGYATISGTSMSSPHVAGAVALLLEDQPDLGADEVRPVLQNSAEPLDWSLAPGAGLLEPSFRQGAGMLQIDKAITATTSVSPNKIALGEDEVTSTTLEISNDGDEAVTYNLGHAGTIGTTGFGDDPWGDWATIIYPQFAGPTTDAQFSEDSVTVEAGGTASVDVTIVNPHYGLYAHQAGGFLTVTEDGADGPTSVVPFAGLAGQLSDIEIFPDERPDVIGLDNALVAAFDEDGNLVLPEDPTFDIEAGDEPVAAAFLGFQAQRIEVEAVHESGYRVDVAAEDFAPRSATEAVYQTFAWDGREAIGNSGSRPAPDGTYTFEVRALTVGADADDADAWETTTSSEFELVGGRGTTNGGRGQD